MRCCFLQRDNTTSGGQIQLPNHIKLEATLFQREDTTTLTLPESKWNQIISNEMLPPVDR